MSIALSPVITPRERGRPGAFAVKSIDLHDLGQMSSPIALLDDFWVRGQPFAPHPHAGFAAVTYVFEDSETSVRSRDSLGGDVVTGPGGIVWTQSGSGIMHEEVPAEPGRELHGAQVFVNLSAKNKTVAPQVFSLAPGQVPEWKGERGDNVRVVVGSFDIIKSPLTPAEPVNFWDVELRSQMSFPLADGHYALLYVRSGQVTVRADGSEQKVGAERGLALQGGGTVTLEGSARLLFLSAAEIRDPVVAHGPFMMNTRAEVEAATRRYQKGLMGRLAPISGY